MAASIYVCIYLAMPSQFHFHFVYILSLVIAPLICVFRVVGILGSDDTGYLL